MSQMCFAQKIKFNLNTPDKGNYGIRGNTAPLTWEKSVPLIEKEGTYEVEINFDNLDALNLEYKYTLETKKELIWEPFLANRFLKSKEEVQISTWGKAEKIDIKILPLLTSSQLMEDYKIVEKAFRELHPGSFRYQSKESFQQHLDELKQSFSQNLSYADTYMALTKFAASVKCGHTHTGVYNQGNLINQITLEQEDKLPFLYRILENRFFITANASEFENIKIGSEIISINGLNAQTIIAKLMPYMSADGSNDLKRIWSMQLLADPSNQFADAYLPLLFPPVNGIYSLEIRDTEEQNPKAYKVRAVERGERSKVLGQKYLDFPKKLEDLWSYSMLDTNIGHLKLGTFGIFNMAMDWKKFLADAFTYFNENNATNLIIDIRGNEGGMDEVAIETARYLISKPTKVNIPKFESRASYQVIPEDLLPYLSTWDKSIYDIRESTTLGNDGFYYFKENIRNLTLDTKKNGFEGKVYLLTDAANSSATFYMAGNYRKMGLATLVGQTTGASKKGINAGNYFFLKLPNSQVEIDLPVMSSIADQEIDEGVVPAIYINPSISDISKGIDTELAFMTNYINNLEND
jgi:hypothetical protein